jgi:hypothetical protein
MNCRPGNPGRHPRLVRCATFAVAALLASLWFAPNALAHTRVGLGISIGAGSCWYCGYRAAPPPVYYTPAYLPPPVYYYPPTAYYAPRPVYYGYYGYFAPRHYRGHYRYRGRHYAHGGWHHHRGHYYHGHR